MIKKDISPNSHFPHHSAAQPVHPKPVPSGNGIPASRILDFVHENSLDGWLTPLVPDAQDRAFVVRCLIGEGPIHHRGSNYILLALLGHALESCGGAQPTLEGAAVPMRLPPHLGEAMAEGNYPLRLPLHALRELAGGDAQQLEAMVDCLTDGPPQHALANVVMVSLIESLLSARAAGKA